VLFDGLEKHLGYNGIVSRTAVSRRILPVSRQAIAEFSENKMSPSAQIPFISFHRRVSDRDPFRNWNQELSWACADSGFDGRDDVSGGNIERRKIVSWSRLGESKT
jgi:hypothetical protein